MKTAAQEIEALIRTQADLCNRHDTRAYAALWSEDCTFVNVVGMHRNGRAELAAEIEYLHADRFRNSQVSMEILTLRLPAPDVAVATVKWHMTGDPGMPGFPTPNGERNGIFTHLIQRTTASWRFVASQNTDVLPIPDPLRASQPALATV